MKKLLLLLFLCSLGSLNAQELLIVDLSVENQVTITATAGTSAATVSGSDSTGCYLENFFTSDHPLTDTLISGNLTSAAQTPDNSPLIYRGGGGTDPGLNIWSYTDDPESTFTLGEIAFSGAATWTVDPAEYTAMLSANTQGTVYFPADTEDDIAGGATAIGTYRVITTLGVNDVQATSIDFHPNPVNNVLNISSQKIITKVDIHNILGQVVSNQKLDGLNGTINTMTLAKGSYFVRAHFEDGTVQNFKIIKN